MVSSTSGPASMVITRSACGDDTIVLSKAKAFGVMTGMYHFDPGSFWTLWGGKSVTIEWFADAIGPTPYPPVCTGACVPLGMLVPANPSAKLVGDFNGDHRSDIAVVGGAGSGSIAMAFGVWGGTFSTTARWVGDFATWAALPGVKKLVGDFDGDGRADILLTGGAGWRSLPVAFSTSVSVQDGRPGSPAR
jgi:hypothetical protein